MVHCSLNAGITAPLPAVIVTLTTDGYQLIRFPPSICSPGGDIFFYSVTIVIDVLLAIGVCFLITIFWIIHTVSGWVDVSSVIVLYSILISYSFCFLLHFYYRICFFYCISIIESTVASFFY